MHLYRLVYCVSCSVPVYWMCLGEDVPVQEVQIRKKKFLVFECDACRSGTKPSCEECKNTGGYLQKLGGSHSDKFVHPVCALSYPTIYQMGSPSEMRFDLCNGLTEPPTEESNQTCAICNKASSRMLKSKDGQFAHAFCIMELNKELIYQSDIKHRFDYEEQMPQKWSIQLFFKDTFNSAKDNFDKLPPGGELKQSPFLRVLSNDQRGQETLCHCEGHSDDKSRVTQCHSCHHWFHQDQDCWGEHVNISQGGPSEQYLKENINEIPE